MIVIILLTAGGGAAIRKWGRVAKPISLGLETYDINGAFLIRWDRLALPVLNATHGTIEIEDGGEKSELHRFGSRGTRGWRLRLHAPDGPGFGPYDD